MLNYRLDFFIERGSMNTFLIGSKDLFEKIKHYETLLAKAIDIEIQINYKMVELENHKISYIFQLDILYPLQRLLGGSLSKDQIDGWFKNNSQLLFNDFSSLEIENSLKESAKKIIIDQNFIYEEIPLKKIKNSLEDLKKLSILLFKKLEFFENKGQLL